MPNTSPKLIVALDVETKTEALELVKRLDESVTCYKIGSQLFTACGPDIIFDVVNKEKEVFLDLKYHDIPNTVANAVTAATGLNGVFMLTVHTQGGEEMLKKSVEAAKTASKKPGRKRPLIIGITVLTSDDNGDNIQKLVLERALLAKKCGLDGVVSSSREASILRQELGSDFVIVTPGIRPGGADAGDQKRISTPREAIDNGSNFLVVGRPIVKAPDPLAATHLILKEMSI